MPKVISAFGWSEAVKEDGGPWGAVMVSLLESRQIRGVNPEESLKEVLVRIATTPEWQIDSRMHRCGRPPGLAPPATS